MKQICEIINQLRATTKTKEKQEILLANKDNALFKKILVYTYDSSKVYGIAKRSLGKSFSVEDSFKDVFEMLDYLITSTRTKETVSLVNSFLNRQEESVKDLYINILLKDLRCGINSKSILKAYPNLFYSHAVQLAYPIDDAKRPKQGEMFALEVKRNGIRASYIPKYRNLVSRQGIEFTGLQHIVDDITRLIGNGFVIDGELVYRNKEGLSNSECFQKTCSIVNSEEGNKSDIILRVFDVIPFEEYVKGQSRNKFFSRHTFMMTIEKVAEQKKIDTLLFEHLLYKGNDQTVIDKLLEQMEDTDEEGLMLYKDCEYKTKRHSGLLKIKKFKTCDVECISTYEGEGKYQGMLGGIIVKYKGFEVGVGSGFDDKQRDYFYKNPEEIVGKIVEVKYKEETKNKEGGVSMQFPIFQCIRYDKDEESYN